MSHCSRQLSSPESHQCPGKWAGFEWIPLFTRLDWRTVWLTGIRDDTRSSLGAIWHGAAGGNTVSDSGSPTLVSTTGGQSDPTVAAGSPGRGSTTNIFRFTHLDGPPWAGRISYRFWSVLLRTTTRASDFPFQKKQFSVSKKGKFRFDSVSLLATLNSMKSQ